jgi:hypothetical protein
MPPYYGPSVWQALNPSGSASNPQALGWGPQPSGSWQPFAPQTYQVDHAAPDTGAPVPDPTAAAPTPSRYTDAPWTPTAAGGAPPPSPAYGSSPYGPSGAPFGSSGGGDPSAAWNAHRQRVYGRYAAQAGAGMDAPPPGAPPQPDPNNYWRSWQAYRQRGVQGGSPYPTA